MPPQSNHGVIHNFRSCKHPPILEAALTPGASVKEKDFNATGLFTSQLNGLDRGSVCQWGAGEGQKCAVNADKCEGDFNCLGAAGRALASLPNGKKLNRPEDR